MKVAVTVSNTMRMHIRYFFVAFFLTFLFS